MEVNYLDTLDHDWLDKKYKRVSSAAMILEDESGRLVSVKAVYKNYWGLPGGIIDRGETPKEAAIRETLEETGIEVDPSGVTFLAVVNRHSDKAQTYQFLFKAPLTRSMLEGVQLQASEIEDYALITKEQVVSRDRRYAKALSYWAEGRDGYIEQVLSKRGGIEEV